MSLVDRGDMLRLTAVWRTEASKWMLAQRYRIEAPAQYEWFSQWCEHIPLPFDIHPKCFDGCKMGVECEQECKLLRWRQNDEKRSKNR